MIASLDHLVLTVRDMAATIAFYEALGMTAQTFPTSAGLRTSLHFGRQKINLHPLGEEAHLIASLTMPGTADLCFLVDGPLEAVRARLDAEGIRVIEGPIERTGATGIILSIYCRDPDGNLVELSQPTAMRTPL